MGKIFEILRNIREEADFKASNNFIKDGLLDSFDIITLVSMLEDEYSILIDALDIVPENFENCDSIIAVLKKNGGEI